MTTLLSDDFSPRFTGDITPMQHQFVDHSNVLFPLTGLVLANFLIRFKNKNTDIVKTGRGTWQFVNAGDAASGIAWYNWHADDVADTGLWAMQVTVPFAAGNKPFDIRTIEWISPL